MEVSEVRKFVWSVWVLGVFLWRAEQIALSAEEPLPSWAEPKRQRWMTGLWVDGKIYNGEWVERPSWQHEREFFAQLLSLPPEDQYLYGLANTLQLLVGLYVAHEGTLPTLEEFLNSPYNVLHPRAWINPYNGSPVQWVNQPIRGNLYYFFPPENASEGTPILVVPLIPRLSFLDFVKPQFPQQDLGVWGVYPATSLSDAHRIGARIVARQCSDYTLTYPCGVRKYHSVEKKYTEKDWRAYIATKALEEIFFRIWERFEAGMPESLEEVRQNYWWFYNTLLENPFSGALIQEVPIQSNSPGDFTYTLTIARSFVSSDFVARGEGGKKLYHYDNGNEYTYYLNIISSDYVRGWEGRHSCDILDEVLGEKKTQIYEDMKKSIVPEQRPYFELCLTKKRFLDKPLRKELGPQKWWWIEPPPHWVKEAKD